MNNIKRILSVTALLVATTLTSVAGSKKVATINGIDIYRIRTAGGFFCPPTTTIVAADPSRPGTLEVINGGVAPSIFQQAFTPVVEGAGLVGAAHMFRPPASQTNVEQSGGGASASAAADADAKAKSGGASATNVNVSNVSNDNTNVNANNNTSSSTSKPGNGPKPKSPKGPKN